MSEALWSLEVLAAAVSLAAAVVHTLPSPGNATAIVWPRADAATLRQVEAVLEDARRWWPPKHGELLEVLAIRVRSLG